MAQPKDNWSSSDYQHSASFVPKLAGKVVQWLDLNKDDVLLDIGCGDGILDLEFSKILSQGNGSLHGIDSSASMIQSAKDLCKEATNCTFEVIDATQMAANASLQQGTYTKLFSNAALHWILREPSSRTPFFTAAHAALRPGGTFALEMGGLGNVAEMRTALLMATARRIGLDAAKSADPWFFPDETWLSSELESAGFRVDRVEREWRPTTADKGGVEGWVRLMGRQFLDAVPDENEREDVVKEAADVLGEVCKNPSGGHMISYVRLRCVATKL